MFIRSLAGLSIFILFARQFGGLRNLFTSKLPWHLLRTLLATGAMFGFFFGLSRMPLVDALTLGFTAPLMVTALSVPMLAPFEYTALIGGAVAGYLIWDEVPDRWVALGATVIIASGLFVVYREIGNALSGRYLRAFSAASAAALRRRLLRKQ